VCGSERVQVQYYVLQYVTCRSCTSQCYAECETQCSSFGHTHNISGLQWNRSIFLQGVCAQETVTADGRCGGWGVAARVGSGRDFFLDHGTRCCSIFEFDEKNTDFDFFALPPWCYTPAPVSFTEASSSRLSFLCFLSFFQKVVTMPNPRHVPQSTLSVYSTHHHLSTQTHHLFPDSRVTFQKSITREKHVAYVLKSPVMFQMCVTFHVRHITRASHYTSVTLHKSITFQTITSQTPEQFSQTLRFANRFFHQHPYLQIRLSNTQI